MQSCSADKNTFAFDPISSTNRQPVDSDMPKLQIFCLVGITALLQAALLHAGQGLVIDTDGMLWDIDLTTGAYTNPRETFRSDCPSCSPFQFGGALELDSEGNLYGMNRNSLYLINADDGEVQPIGTLGTQEYFPGGLAWDDSTSTMFGSHIAIPNTNDVVRHLTEVNLNTGQATSVVGNLFHTPHMAGLSFDNSGNLFSLWLYYLGTNKALLRLDKTNGQVLQSISLSGESIDGTLAGMDFDPDTNTMYIAKRPSNFSSPASLYTVNLDTGFLSLVGTYDEPIRATSLVIFPDLNGDFNSDGLVNGADFLKWQRGESPNPLSASDLADWQANYGISASLVSSVNYVPEPSTVLLVAMATVFGFSTRRSL